MSDYHVRVRPSPDGYTATIRTLAGTHPDAVATLGVPAVGHAATANAAILAAVIAARIPSIPAERLSRYAC